MTGEKKDRMAERTDMAKQEDKHKEDKPQEDIKELEEKALGGDIKSPVAGTIVSTAYSTGEKTEAGGSLADGLDAACAAANEGIEFTKTIAATKGRASYLGDRSIGHQDPGATSATMTLEVIRDFVKG